VSDFEIEIHFDQPETAVKISSVTSSKSTVIDIWQISM